jgi:hypothetical protein
LPVDNVGDASFQCSDGFLTGFALGQFLVVVIAALAGIAELADRSDVEDVVEFTVPSRVESMSVVVP